MSKIHMVIDGREIEADENGSVLSAALEAGIYIPHICSHPDLESIGECKLCVVNIEGVDGAVTSCTTKVKEGMKVYTKGERLDTIRRIAMELMLAAHPHDCTTCKMYLHCEFQAMMQYTNAVNGRMRDVTKKTTFINVKNPLIVKEMERCIQCGRCIRVCKDVRKVGVLKLNKFKENNEIYVGTEGDVSLADAGCKFCSACVEVCPTGSLQDKPGVFRFDLPKKQAYIPCSAECPAHTDIPEYIRLVKEGKCSEATAVIREKLSFPHSLGLVCTHACESKCKRSYLNDSLAIRDIKRYAVEHDTEKLWKKNSKRLPDTGKKVAVIGGGPAGMTAGLYLAKKGHDTTVFEQYEKAGGYLQYGIPEYRLPKDIVQKEIDELLGQGVKLVTGRRIESVADLKKEGFDAVVLAMGTPKGKKVKIYGMEKGPSFTAADFLHKVIEGEDIPEVSTGKRVIVLGGGSVAFDAARTSARLGAKVDLFCLEARDKMLADEQEVVEALEEGVNIHCSTTNLEITGDKNITGLRYADISGFSLGANGLSIDIIEGSEKVIGADTIIFAFGQSTDIPAEFGVPLNPFGYPLYDEKTYETLLPGVFAAGDVITGTKTVISAVAQGREAASKCDIYLGGDGNIEEVLYDREEPNPEIGKEEGFAYEERKSPDCLEVCERADNFKQVDLGMSDDNMKSESDRCLQCDLRCELNPVRMWTDPYFSS